jgi:hypothetical protein
MIASYFFPLLTQVYALLITLPLDIVLGALKIMLFGCEDDCVMLAGHCGN